MTTNTTFERVDFRPVRNLIVRDYETGDMDTEGRPRIIQGFSLVPKSQSTVTRDIMQREIWVPSGPSIPLRKPRENIAFGKIRMSRGQRIFMMANPRWAFDIPVAVSHYFTQGVYLHDEGTVIHAARAMPVPPPEYYWEMGHDDRIGVHMSGRYERNLLSRAGFTGLAVTSRPDDIPVLPPDAALEQLEVLD